MTMIQGGTAAGVPDWNDLVAPAAVICTLGEFRVLRQGEPVPSSEWQSKKARDVLKMLVARRGRPAPREQLMEALWPEEDPARSTKRLSVLLTTVRAILDPGRGQEPDYYVVGDNYAVALNLAHVTVDVETFLATATTGLSLLRGGHTSEALEWLARADMLYRGEFCEEDAYDDWAADLREEARAVAIACLRARAERAGLEGDADLAVRCYLWLLAKDRYDEPAHLGLVQVLAAAGRHGESRRRYDCYTAAMDELGLRHEPFPGLTPSEPERQRRRDQGLTPSEPERQRRRDQGLVGRVPALAAC
jgi:DNA-binding SARP family transcriptional activator